MSVEDGLDPDRREDRQMLELLNELRVALPGVQILFGFLLTVPFATGFERVTDFQRDTYFVTLMLCAVTTTFLLAPAAAHRMLFHRGRRRWLIEHANRMLLAGLLTLSLALCGAVLLVTDYLFDSWIVYVVPPAGLLMTLSIWFVRPLLLRER